MMMMMMMMMMMIGDDDDDDDDDEHLEEPVQLRTVLLLLRLQLGEQVDEPLEALLVPVDPDEVDLPQVEHPSLDLVRPAVVAARARVLDIKVPGYNVWMRSI